MGCKEFSAVYLNILNALLAIGGLAIVIYSGLAIDDINDFDEIVNNGAVVTPLVFGVFLMLVSIIGLCGVLRKNKILLVIYVIAATVITFVVLGFGAVLLTFSGVLDDIENADVQFGVDTVEARVVDFELAVYNKCCADQFAGAVEALSCDLDDNGLGCFTNSDRFNDFLADIPEQLCDVLEEVEINGAPLVGDPDIIDGACGTGDPEVFVQEISQFIEDNIQPIGIGNLVLAVLMLMDIITTCVLLCSSRDEYDGKAKPAQAAENNPKYNDVEATNVVHGGNEIKY